MTRAPAWLRLPMLEDSERSVDLMILNPTCSG